MGKMSNQFLKPTQTKQGYSPAYCGHCNRWFFVPENLLSVVEAILYPCIGDIEGAVPLRSSS